MLYIYICLILYLYVCLCASYVFLHARELSSILLPVQHACGASKPSKKDSPGFSEHVISEKSLISVLFRVCTLCKAPPDPRPSQSLFWAGPGPGGDLGGSRGANGFTLCFAMLFEATGHFTMCFLTFR